MGKAPESPLPAAQQLSPVVRPPRPRTRSRPRLLASTGRSGPDGSSAGMHYAAGDLIADKYQLTSVIGEGGMGSVWLARNIVLHVDVALKLVNREIASKEATQRLIVEARAAARVSHGSIVRIHDFGKTSKGDPFIVMELLQGESLADVLERKDRLPAINAVQMLLPIVSALATAHAEGIVHRDLKPENIILVVDHAGGIVPKLVDFGVAKVAPERFVTQHDAKAPEMSADLKRRLTRLGSIVGSPDYLSPEQARGDLDVDERADLWSISVLLYELIVGNRPFDGDTIEKLMMAILVREPEPITALGVGDEALWTIIERGLAKNRGGRWQNAQAVGEALANWLVGQGVTTDITGSSVQQQWLRTGTNRPFSMVPPSMRARDDGRGDSTRAPPLITPVAILGATATERRERFPSEPTLAGTARGAPYSRKQMALLAVGLLLVTVLPTALLALAMSEPAPAATPVVDPATEASATLQVESAAPTNEPAVPASAAATRAASVPDPAASTRATAAASKKKRPKPSVPTTTATVTTEPATTEISPPSAPAGLPIPDRANF